MTLEPFGLSHKPFRLGWFDLPFEMREMIIDRMDPESRCRFAECSKLCEKEVKGSKNYLYGIGIEGLKYGEMRLLVYTECTYPCNYYFRFVDAGNNQTIVQYRSKCWEDADEYNTGPLEWKKIESGKPNDVRIRYFKEYIEKYKRSIKFFGFNDGKEPIHQFSIKELKNLRKLEVEKVRNDCPGLIESGFIDWDQMLRIKVLDVVCSNTYFSFENILNFTGEEAIIRSDSLNQIQVNEYLKMRKKGEIHEKLNVLFICIRRPFDVSFIMQGLDVFDYTSSFREKYEFSFRSDTNKNGFFRVYYCFSVYISIDWKGFSS